MVFLRSFCGLVTGPNQLWLRPAINWSQPVWTGDYCRYVAIKKYIYDYLLAAWPSLTRRGQGSLRWVTWPHCRCRGCGGCVVVVDLGSPGIVDVAWHCRR